MLISDLEKILVDRGIICFTIRPPQPEDDPKKKGFNASYRIDDFGWTCGQKLHKTAEEAILEVLKLPQQNRPFSVKPTEMAQPSPLLDLDGI